MMNDAGCRDLRADARDAARDMLGAEYAAQLLLAVDTVSSPMNGLHISPALSVS